MHAKDIWREVVMVPVGYIPAVILGLLLNLLDAISYGMITFPTSNPIFANFGPDGISMFFVSCIVSQLTYSCGGSVFGAGNGRADSITRQIGEDKPHQVVATTIIAFAISSIMTGVAFYILGALKLGSLIGFFPRHILVGTIGGVGWFLVATGIEVSARLEGGMIYDIPTMKELFLNTHTLLLWTSALGVALLLRALQHKIKHPLLVPAFFMIVPIVFWFVVLVAGLDVNQVRQDGWVFHLVEGDVPFWHFYTYYDFNAIDWAALSSTIPAMLALTFFGVLHVPINVPALGVSTNRDDVDVNKELVAHGISNTLSGCLGSVQNYLVYTNSLLFIKSGADSRLAGLMLAGATAILWICGPGIVGYIPIMVVGALIFHLGLDLLKEALVDTWGNLHHFEYITICAIIFFMAWLGFVEGIFLGIVMACIFFVVTNSKRGSIRAVYTGATIHSTVRRLYRQQKFLNQVGNQIMIVLLQGYLFFGTIGQVERCIRDALDQRAWEQHPIRFLILDLKLAQGIDFSASEAFVRLKRLLKAKDVYLVLCNVDLDTEIGHALWKAGVMHTEEDANNNLQCFAILNEALEWCENILLETYYAKQAALAQQQAVKNDANDIDGLNPTLASSPRQNMLVQAVQKVFNVSKFGISDAPVVQSNMAQPIAIMTQTFGELSSNANPDLYMHLAPYFVRVTIQTGTILWTPNEPSTCLYIIEKGLLKSSIVELAEDSERHQVIANESILPGTIVGELGLFTESPRTKTLTVEQDSVLWKMSKEDFNRMLEQEPTIANRFMRMALNFSAERLKLVSSFAFELN
ncbi:sulfate transporter family-domain-containing protein [Umbelopsis sp. PMI_123]|nr:sulfate transporter family-domain-containing protein [Umbelopsis sp. PMI_123]